jgi:sulfite exporter TauE/SafE
MEYLAAFTLGLMGSLHCVGMCGPLMLSVNATGAWKQPVLYQAGRLTTYVFLGFLLGMFGFGLQLWNAQSTITIVSGLMLLTFAFFRWDPAQLLQRLPGYGTLQLTVRKKMSSIIKKDSLQAHYGLGICNGLLPCGLVYLAIVGAANMSTPIMGGGFMLAFGLGTLPLLVATLYAGRRLLNELVTTHHGTHGSITRLARLGSSRTPGFLPLSGCFLSAHVSLTAS